MLFCTYRIIRVFWVRKDSWDKSHPTVNPALPNPPLTSPGITSFEYLQICHFPWQPLPTLENPFNEDFFPNGQSKHPLVQPEAIFSCYLREETDPHLATSFQVVVKSRKIASSLLFSRLSPPSSLSCF